MFFTILIIIAIIAAVLLGLIVLIQNPKGGGLSGTFGGAANQIFGYKRTTDDVEKITWGLVIVVFALCLGAAAMKPTVSEAENPIGGPQAKRKSTLSTPPTEQVDPNATQSEEGATPLTDPANPDNK